MRRFIIVSILLAGMVLLLLMGYLLATPFGLRTIVTLAQYWGGDAWQIENVSGTLLSEVNIDKIRYNSPTVILTGEKIAFRWSPLGIVTSTVAIKQLSIQAMHIQLPAQAAAMPALTTQEIISGLPSIAFRVERAHIAQLTVTQGQWSRIIDNIHAQINNTSRRLQVLALDLTTKLFDEQPLNISLSGQVQRTYLRKPLEATIEWRYAHDNISYVGSTHIAGSLEHLSIAQTIKQPVSVHSEGWLEPMRDPPRWQLTHEVASFSPDQIDASWPAITLHGKLKSHGTGTSAQISGQLATAQDSPLPVQTHLDVRYHNQQIRLATTTHFTYKGKTGNLTLHGTLDHSVPNGQVTLEGKWKNMPLPVHQASDLLAKQGHFSLVGMWQDYQVTLASDIEAPQIGSSHWQWTGKGNQNQLRLSKGQVQWLKNTLHSTFFVDWRQGVRWQASLQGRDLKISQQYPNLAPSLNVALTTTGELINNHLKAVLKARAGSNKVQFDVERKDNNWDVNYQVDLTRLAQLGPAFSGSLRGEGNVRGKLSAPIVTLKWQGQDVHAMALWLKKINAQITLNMTNASAPFTIKISAADLGYHGYALDALQLEARGSGEAHTLSVHSQRKNAQFDVRGKGKIQAGRWQLMLDEAQYQEGKAAPWLLAAPAALLIGPAQSSLSLLCLQASEQKKSCLSFAWQDNRYHVQFDSEQLPVQWITSALGADAQAEGTVDIHGQLERKEKSVAQGQLRVRLSQGQLHYQAPGYDEAETITFQGGNARIDLTESLLDGQWALHLQHDNQIMGDFSLANFRLGAIDKSRQAIKATLKANVDVAQLDYLLPRAIRNQKGHAALDLRVSGTLASPHIEGHGALEQGHFSIPDLGIVLDKIQLSGKQQVGGGIALLGSAQMGAGTLQMTGNVHWQEAPRATLHLSGKHLTVMDTTDAHILMDPDISITASKSHVDIKGTILIPKADIHPIDTREIIKPSVDVVVVSRDSDNSKRARALTLNSHIQLTMGKDVIFTGFDLTTRVKGQLQIMNRNWQPARATGELQLVEGKYQFRGQTLNIETGRLLFAGGLLTNPGLDIRAQRTVNIQSVKDISLLRGISSQETVPGVVGVDVRGTIDEPQMTLFSDPVVSDADRLSYLIFGIPSTSTSSSQGSLLISAFGELSSSLGVLQTKNMLDQLSHATGIDTINIESSAQSVDPETGELQAQAALVLGKAITPRLRVRYSIGLLDPVNMFTLHFQLTNHWLLQAETSSIGQSGGDAIYQIELGD